MDRERLAENLQTFLPLMHKKIMKCIPSSGIPKQQLGLLFFLSKEDEKPMSFYSERMMIPKPNLTVLADKLIQEGLVQRIEDKNDRRVITLKITDKGRKYLEEYKLKAREEMAKKFEPLSDNDVKRLNELLEEMKEIFNRIDM